MSVEAKLEDLKRRFAERATRDHAALEGALLSGDREALIAISHNLAGIAGMLGQAEMGAAALALEEAALSGKCHRDEAARLLGLLKACQASF